MLTAEKDEQMGFWIFKVPRAQFTKKQCKGLSRITAPAYQIYCIYNGIKHLGNPQTPRAEARPEHQRKSE